MQGWTWANTLTALALILSTGALIVSARSARHHPKPKIVIEWFDRLSSPLNDLPYTQGVSVWNYGDAPATDLRLHIDSIHEHLDVDLQHLWLTETQIKPGQSRTWHLPMQPVKIGLDPYGMSDEKYVAIDPSSPPVRPLLTVTWRQQPFTRRQKLKSRALKPPQQLPPRRITP